MSMIEKSGDPSWEGIETHQQFDASFELFENSSIDLRNDVGNSLPNVNVSSLLILWLVERLCSFIEADPVKAKKLYKVIVMQLESLNFIDEISSSDSFKDLRSRYQDYLFQLVEAARKVVSLQTDALVPISRCNEDEADCGAVACRPWSRYLAEFDTLSYINKGGFGEVFKVKNKLDGQDYAIKKILFRSQDQLSKTIQREVTVLASLHHPNIVKYHGAWLETILTELTPAATNKVTIIEQTDNNFEYSCSQTNNLPKTTKTREISSGGSYIEFKTESQQERSISKMEVVLQKTTGDSQIFSGCTKSESSDSPSNKALVPCSKNVTVNQSILYIQMELCGLTLRQWMDERQNHILSGSAYGSLQLRTSLSFFWQLAAALEYLHANKIIHHDVKPGNIFVAGERGIKLGDFGLACQYELSKSSPHHAIGTYTYAAPEQLEGGLCNFKSDIYSCGMILLELILSPFKTTSERIDVLSKLRKNGAIPAPIRDKFPQWEKVISAVTKYNPKKRPSAAELQTSALYLISKFSFPSVIEEYSRTCSSSSNVTTRMSNSNIMHTTTTSRTTSSSKLMKQALSLSNQMCSLTICDNEEVVFQSKRDSGDHRKGDTDEEEVAALRRDNSSLKQVISNLRQEVALLQERIRLQDLQLHMK